MHLARGQRIRFFTSEQVDEHDLQAFVSATNVTDRKGLGGLTSEHISFSDNHGSYVLDDAVEAARIAFSITNSDTILHKVNVHVEFREEFISMMGNGWNLHPGWSLWYGFDGIPVIRDEDGRHLAFTSGAATDNIAVVKHGGDATVERPQGFAVVFWIGSVEPQNAENTDVYINSSL